MSLVGTLVATAILAFLLPPTAGFVCDSAATCVTSCPKPHPSATCNTGTGVWTINGGSSNSSFINIQDFTTVECQVHSSVDVLDLGAPAGYTLMFSVYGMLTITNSLALYSSYNNYVFSMDMCRTTVTTGLFQTPVVFTGYSGYFYSSSVTNWTGEAPYTYDCAYETMFYNTTFAVLWFCPKNATAPPFPTVLPPSHGSGSTTGPTATTGTTTSTTTSTTGGGSATTGSTTRMSSTSNSAVTVPSAFIAFALLLMPLARAVR